MISPAVLAAFFFAAAAELLFPVVFLLVFCLRRKSAARPVLIGAAAFAVSQVALRIPLLQVLGTQSWYRAFALQAVPYVLMLSFTAGLFEETARYVCAANFLKKQRAFRDAVVFGLGHGFCEVVLITGLVQVNNITYALMINSGNFQELTAKLPASVPQQILSAMLAVTPGAVLLGVLERLFAVAFHIFASVLIFKGVNERKIGYYFWALAVHTGFNLGGSLVTKYVGVWAGELLIGVLAAAAVCLTVAMKKSFAPPEAAKQALS